MFFLIWGVLKELLDDVLKGTELNQAIDTGHLPEKLTSASKSASRGVALSLRAILLSWVGPCNVLCFPFLGLRGPQSGTCFTGFCGSS